MKDNHASKPTAGKSVGIWIRVSTEDQAQGDSPEHHEERARNAVKSRPDWQVKEVYNLAGQSGKAVMQHPEAKRMMRDIERGHISGLIFSKLARLSRNRRELEDFSDFFDKHKADLVSLSENIDTSTAGGRMFFHLLGVFAQWEREEITERVNASVITRAKMGKSINGKAPYGYQWQGRKLVIHRERAAVRRQAYELFAKCRRKGQVAMKLNALGYRTSAGKIWRDTSIQRILADPSAKGFYIFNTERRTGVWQSELKPENEWGKAECEPIVSEALWNEVNEVMEEQLKAFKKPGKAPVHLFSGLTYCACGEPEQKNHKMYVSSDSPKYFCRKCRNKMPMADLEVAILAALCKFFGQPERVANHLETAERNLAEKTVALEIHKREMQKVRDKMTQVEHLLFNKQISGDGFRDLYAPLEAQMSQLKAALPKLEAEVNLLQVNKLTVDDVCNESQTLQDRWPKMAAAEKRQKVEALIGKIVITDDNGKPKLSINFMKQPNSLDDCKNQQRLGSG